MPEAQTPMRSAREAKGGLSQTEIATRTEIPQSMISLYETGIVKPPLRRALRIARELERPLAELWPDLAEEYEELIAARAG